ncbi:NYN domain-containing protein [Phormidium tenue]|uniref:NYN domain-containing protein n=1 Tax=Phormidium tenue NIES-30 TaxID=549789 RepID=A0A1U7J534_9CYAN|nr:NYN domain-containing protein [Phormidium tenue]MBD2232638.1 NYN domain-containing protein [Phormidium tenue FACHB-1052]OKH47769.1 hypothetical protein NIES30_12365 [Phormidium tenue NIES-30]
MFHKVLGFADGENLTLRYQEMVENGCIPTDEVFHIPDLVVWHPKITEQYYCDFTRLSFYQTVVGAEEQLDWYRQEISKIQFSYSTGGGDSALEGTGSLYPKLFKKAKKGKKTKSVDINLTVDMMRYANDRKFDALLLLSGDGDYLPLVEELTRQGKQVWLAAFSSGLSQRLRFAADDFTDLDKLFFQHNSSAIPLQPSPA